VKKLVKVQHFRIGVLASALLLSTLVLSTSINTQNVIAQQQGHRFTIPALGQSDIDQSSSQPNNINNNNDDTPTGLSDSSTDNRGPGVYEEQETIGFEDRDDTTTTNEQDNTTTTNEQDNTTIDPLAEEIKNELNEALSGITGP
jgi:hypothetical protein